MKTKDRFSYISIIIAVITLLFSLFRLAPEFKGQLFDSSVFTSMIAAFVGIFLGVLITRLLSKKTKRVFLSYPSELRDLALKLEKELESNRINVIRAQEFLNVGDSINEKVNQYIDQVDTMIVLIDRNTKKSQFIQNEINRAIKQGKMIIPLLVEEDKRLIPKSLKSIKYETISNNNILIEKLVDKLMTMPNM